jgi:3'-phosphoadenosine 5'-phosphosulfate sulfotransferase (PAPS reductase)/FAD synthetase
MDYALFWDMFAEWYSQGESCANLIGIRTVESLNRFRAIMNQDKKTMLGRMWTKQNTAHTFNCYPIYDWRTEDIWVANAKFGWDYNLTIPYLAKLWFEQKGRCALTGIMLEYESGDLQSKNPYRASVDRIDNNHGYVQGNVRLLTHWANNAKSTWSDETFIKFVKSASAEVA